MIAKPKTFNQLQQQITHNKSSKQEFETRLHEMTEYESEGVSDDVKTA